MPLSRFGSACRGVFTLLPHKLLFCDRLDVQVLLEGWDMRLPVESADIAWKVIEERYTFVFARAFVVLHPVREVDCRNLVVQGPLVGSVYTDPLQGVDSLMLDPWLICDVVVVLLDA